MKIVYSYIPHENPISNSKLLPEELISTLYLSVLKANQLYDKVEIYTNKRIGKYIKELGIPFSKIDTELLNREPNNTATVSKLKTYIAQTEPYIHIDLDTILFSKVLYSPQIPVTFAHPDCLFSNERNLINEIPIISAYLAPLTEGYLPDFYAESIPLSNIPNMNIVAVTDPSFFSKCSSEALKLYDNNPSFFNKDYYRFCTLEQYLIYGEMLKENENYYSWTFERECFLHSGEPFSFDEGFPFTISINNYTKRKIHLDNIEDIKKLNEENFGGYLHLMGDIKRNPIVQCIILHRLQSEFGEEPIRKIKEYYKKIDVDIYKLIPKEYLNKLNIKL